MFPEFLYRLTPRDEQVTQVEIIAQVLTQNVANATLTTNSYTVPLGKVLIIKSGIIQCTPGAALIPLYAQMAMYHRGDTSQKYVLSAVDFQNISPAAGQTSYGSSQHAMNDVYVAEGSTIFGYGVFSGGGGGQRSSNSNDWYSYTARQHCNLTSKNGLCRSNNGASQSASTNGFGGCLSVY